MITVNRKPEFNQIYADLQDTKIMAASLAACKRPIDLTESSDVPTEELTLWG